MSVRVVAITGLFAAVLLAVGCPSRTRGTEGSSSSSSSSSSSGTPGNVDGGGDAGVTAGDAGIPDAATVDASQAGADAGLDGGACGPNQTRDGRGMCRTVCEATGDCPTGESCNVALGLCFAVPVVTCNPSQCAAGFVCPSPDAGHVDAGADGCVPGPGYCAADRDCNLVQRCDNHLCVSRAGDIVQTCSADAGCPLLMTCRFGVCTGCLADLQCSIGTPGSRCLLGTCVTTGALGPGGNCIGKTCPAGQRCSVATGECEATCQSNTDCADAGEICAPVLNQCVTDFACTADGGCAAGLTCAGAGLGMESGICIGCNDTTPCKPRQACIAGACFPDLAATACTGVTCPQDRSCDPQGGACYPSNGTCTADTDCRTGHQCNFVHLCAGCSIDADCRPAQRCFIGTCLPGN